MQSELAFNARAYNAMVCASYILGIGLTTMLNTESRMNIASNSKTISLKQVDSSKLT
jgi:hypothetical protein